MVDIESKLKGGYPNSLGNTIEVVNSILEKEQHFDELFNCYFSDDEIVRLRVSNAMKRICKEKTEYLLPYIDRFIKDIAKIDQASTKWTIAQLFSMLEANFSLEQLTKAKEIVKQNLATETDWIVLNTSMETLAHWAKDDTELHSWLVPHLERLSKDKRKSVSKKASKLLGPK